MQTSQETTNLVKALIAAAPEIQSIPKSKEAGFGKFAYKYATLDSLIDMLRKVLPKHGLWFIQMPTRNGETSSLTTRIFHSSGEWMEDCIEMTDTQLVGTVTDTQKVGASITYYRRYALSAIFGIAADEDVDGNLNNVQRPQQPSKPQPKPQPKEKSVTERALDVIRADYKSRIESGEVEQSILKCYADILKTDDVRKVPDLNQAELVALATAIKQPRKGE